MDQDQLEPGRRGAGGGKERALAEDQQPGRATADEADDVPPWEHSGSWLTPLPQAEQTLTLPPGWAWEAAVEQPYAGSGLDTLSGTGRMAAVLPLRPGSSAWSAGVRAPYGTRATVEVDEQPSVQMRALRSGNLARATIIVSAGLLISRLLGLFRTTLFAAAFGNGATADAYTFAYTLPDLIYTVIAGGALASAFIPIFTNYLVDKRDREAAWRLASTALNLAIGVVTICAILGVIFAQVLLRAVFASLFTGPACVPVVTSACEGPLTVVLTRIMLLQPIFLGGATIAIAILQARQSFVLPTIGQVVYTASQLGGIALAEVDARTHILGGHLGIRAVAWGVVAGALLQLLIQMPGLIHARMHYSFSLDVFQPGMREVLRLLTPRFFNSLMLYASMFVNRWLLSVLITGPGSAGKAYGFSTAFTLILLPTGVFGMAVSQAAFPSLATFVAAGEWSRFRAIFLQTLRGILFLAVPSGLGMMVLADPLSRLILAHGSFNLGKLGDVTGPLVFYSVGLAGLATVEILTRGFYVLQNTRTPTEVSLLQFMFVIGLSVVLFQPMGANGLALASSLAWLGEALVLLLLLRPRIGGLDLHALGGYVLNVLAAAVLCALTAYLVYTLLLVALPLQPTSTAETVHMIMRLTGAIISAMVVYFAAARFLRIDDALPLRRIAQRILGRGAR